MFYITGIIISFFLCLLLLGKKNNTAADYLLSFWLFWIGVHLLLYYLSLSQKIYEFPFLLGLSIPMPLVHPPLLFLYTAALCRGQLPKRWWWHFTPILACYLYLIPFALLPADQKIWVFQNKGAGYEGFMLLISIGINVSGVVYTIAAYRLLQRHRKVIADLFSYQEKINLRWLQYLIYGLAGIWLTVLVGYDPVVYGAAVLFVLFIGYFGVRQVGIFTNQPALQIVQASYDSPDFQSSDGQTDTAPMPTFSEKISPDAAQPSDKKKYEKSGLTPEAAEALHRRLQDLMNTGQLFKESDLSLTDLAERLDTHPNYLSQIINEKEGKNFYDYINSMRVEVFLKMVADPKNRRFTLLALALECGFNSKSAFNRYFKKATGQAPSEYLVMNDEL
ncbi:MAG TPA: helix-turn-helix domain-containing protein [Saprospiraceae bacterium]|nr:helix-turn-helix domain-containing protein [Saprospiraceae bacterium]